MDTKPLAERIRERFPEGLTGILAIGGTRTAFILEYNRQSENPGQIDSFEVYVKKLVGRTTEFLKNFLELGGQHMIVPLYYYQGLKEKRGEAYAEAVLEPILRGVVESFVPFYNEYQVDPYFAGIDTLLRLPENELGYQFGKGLAEFQQSWNYQEGRHKLIWEVAPIPLFSLWRAPQVMGAEETDLMEQQLENAQSLGEISGILYRYYARALYGTDIPMAHFYLGTNRNGDLKMRSILPMTLYDGGPFRMYYTPYPSLFTTRETMAVILEDLAFGKQISSLTADYRDKFSKEVVEAEYAYFTSLKEEPRSTLGLMRQLAAGASSNPPHVSNND